MIEFSKERAAYARGRVWHRTQQIEEQSDGTVHLAFTCKNLVPVVSWVLEWGPHARVIARQSCATKSCKSFATR